jgi:hypothetical protein
MTAISGTLTESLPVTDWLARAYRLDTGAFLGESYFTGSNYSVDCAGYSGLVAVALFANQGASWTGPKTQIVGDYTIPTNFANTPYFYKCTTAGTTDGTIGDSQFSGVVLLLHCNGANNSTSFTDVKGHTVTANGDAKISTAQSKFGGASAAFDGSGDYLSIPDSNDWDFGTTDFTVELNACFTSPASTQTLIGDYTPSLGWLLQRTSGGYLRFMNGDAVIANYAWTPTANQWYHLAVCRSGTSLRIFVDGSQIGTTVTDSTNFSGSTAPLLIGTLTSSLQPFNGYIDEVRVTKNARYTSNFAAPSAAFLDAAFFPGSEPSWPTTIGNTVTDGSVVWTCFSRLVQPLVQSPLIPA